jgi:tetratricopeptide (TPR) repeat protein
MYTLNDQPAKAIEAIEEGLSNNPDSAALCTYLGVMYLENGDYDQAEVFLDKAERIDPELPLISMFRQVLKMERARPLAKKKSIDFPVLNKPNREERRGRKHFQ